MDLLDFADNYRQTNPKANKVEIREAYQKYLREQQDTFMTQETEPKTLTQIASPQYFFRYGRPLWGGLLKTTDAYTNKQVLSPEKILEICPGLTSLRRYILVCHRS
ncbi:10761_t:CDS:2 [Paraglomus occultum]|uniref:10761_t:CDS:1 n=1 Tax=Paraglomus occultum TaxID=144539 RepID=A0A9N9BG79_9GLOM|nr:10761_t:CDS:2 [Paraglomus occultum]